MQRSSLQEELKLLSEKKFLLSNDNLNDINNDSYPHEIWADVFWRRRFRHARREDPELKYILKTNPSKVLEIGAAYGRVLRKLMEWEGIDTNLISFTGIEICKHFQSYFQRYQSQYPSLQRVEFIFDNFLTTSVFKENSFDIILLPMNTLANFSYNTFESLFKTVNRYLTEDGMFFFSNYKIPNKELLDSYISRKQGYSGDLLLDLGSGLITAEYYDLPPLKTEYGAYSVTYICYSTFSRDYSLKKRELFRSITTFILPKPLKNIIAASGFSLEIFDDSSHSSVFGLAKTR